MLITPEVAMAHLRASADDADMILIYTDAAEQSAVDYLGRNVYGSAEAMAAAVADETAGELPMVINAAIKAAMLLTLGHLYSNRENVVIGVSTAELPHGAHALLQPHRIGLGV